jgi:nicotinate-nucleotide adenylyltransferase
LWIAEAALETLSLDFVRWIPAATSPLKPQGPVAPAVARLQMLRLALAGAGQHLVDDREIKRGEVSFTVDTLRALHDEAPEDERFLIIGSDSLASFPRWHEPTEIAKLARLAVIQRGGDAPINTSILHEIDGLKATPSTFVMLPVPTIEISSSDLRARVFQGRSIRFRTPRAVESMIFAQRLYHPPGEAEWMETNSTEPSNLG